MRLHAGVSDNGFDWEISPMPIKWQLDDPILEPPEYGYDPRVCWIDDRFWITWCNGFHGPSIGIGYTKDFSTFHMIANALPPFNRNGVLFPRRIEGDFVLLHRPSDNGHTPFGEIFLTRSRDGVTWGRHQWVMRGEQPWESTKIGAGPVPIETTEGWLLFYHGVLTSCNGFVYHLGACLLDREQPWRLIARTSNYLLSPWASYEQSGDVPNVVFPCAALCNSEGKIALFYGAADTTTCLAFTTVEDVLQQIFESNRNP